VELLGPDDPEQIGSFRLLARLGVGCMGVVYLGRSPGGLMVAVKVIWGWYVGDAAYQVRFKREVTAARTVSGAYTASVLDADPDAGTPWLVTAYLPGLTLREAIAAYGRFPPAAVRTLAAGLAEAFIDIHQTGLTHRDLTPGNVMLTADGPRVIDFGIARPEDATSITRAGDNLGTRGFMSPEQAAGSEVGQASDVFSFGAVLAYAATAKEPFHHDGVASGTVPADLSGITDQRLRDLIRDCLHREQGRRPLAAELLEGLDGKRPRRAPRGCPWVSSRRSTAVRPRLGAYMRIP
jgi:serine/threonine protein kinase